MLQECAFPIESQLSDMTVKAAVTESYQIPLSRRDLPVLELYLGIFDHLPRWTKILIIVRNWMARFAGLHADTPGRVWHSNPRQSYKPGDRLVRFTLFSADETEIVTGRDDQHLDFRVSVLKLDAERLVVSTVFVTHNKFGERYLQCVLPFHRPGLRRLIKSAAQSGRI